MTNSDERAFLNAISGSAGRRYAAVGVRRLARRTQSKEQRITRRRKLERDAKAILKVHGAQWSQALRDTKLVREWTFRRGFLDGISMSATLFARNAEQVFEVAPTIRSAYFPDASNEVNRLAGCKYLARLASVNLREMCKCGHCPIHNDLRALFNSKHTNNLTTLNIAGDRMDAEGTKRLAKSTALARLTSLDVSNNPLGIAGIAALGASKHLKRLVTLSLSATDLGSQQALECLAAVKNLPALRHLNLSRNLIGTEALQAFLASPLFAQLTSLDLSYNGFADAGAKLLAAIPTTAQLQSLDVRSVNLTQRGKALLKKRFGRGVKT